ncbi:MAG: FmdB family zinc ribbon protein [Candidatus Binataceae bacterium]
MPIYECHCGACDLDFEALAPLTEASRSRPCPQCGRMARRVISGFAIGSPAPSNKAAADGASHPHRASAASPVIPAFARPCWMDDKSAQRFAAYKVGRGHEYDDRQTVHQELRVQRGEPPEPVQADSPVAKMLARKKAREVGKAESKETVAPAGSDNSNS